MKRIIVLLFIIIVINFPQVSFAQNDPYAQIKTSIENLPNGSGALILLPNGDKISRDDGEQFPTYSVIKLWIAAATFYDANNSGTEVDSDTLELVTKMLTNSDNVATNTLIDRLGGCSNGRCDVRVMQVADGDDYPRTYIRRKMLETATRPENDNLTSPKDAVNFMQNLINRNIVDSETSETLISILTQRTQSGSDPFKPNSPLPANAEFLGKSGILGQGRNDVGTFLDSNGDRIFFAIFIPSGGPGTDQIISNIEQLLHNPSTTPQTIQPPSTSGQQPGPLTGNQTLVTARACVKVGAPADSKPAICSQPTSTATSTSGGTSAGPAQPAPTVEGGRLTQAIKDEFGVEMQGAWTEQALRWIYEAFYRWKQTNPKFMNFINGQPIILIPNASGANAYGNTVKVGQTYAEGEKFLGTLTHEFGHVIYWTKPLGENFRIEAENLYITPGAVTTYGDGDNTENYPEIISYCLTRRSVGTLISQQRWEEKYKPLAEKIVGPCI